MALTTKRRATSFDVARKAGVSRSVVSAVLNGTPGIGVSAETRQTVLDAIRELGYEVNVQARGMKTGISHCVAVRGNTTNPLFLQALEGIQDVCVNAGYHVLLYGDRDDRSGLLNLYRQRRIDGIITLDNAGESDGAWATAVKEGRVPYVSIEGYPSDEDVHSVNVDYGRSVTDALDCMRAHGAEHPIYLQFLLQADAEIGAERVRREAYESWMRARDAEPERHRFLANDEEGLNAFFRSWRVQNRRPSVLINWSSELNRVIRAANKLGLRVGEHYRLMALDNTLRVNRYLLPSVACMEIPYAEMGRLAGERLLELLGNEARSGDDKARKIGVRAELFEGESL